MAQIALGSYAVQFPVGGYLSWILQWLAGLKHLGHDVVFVEKSSYERSCYDPDIDEMTDDCSYGVAALDRLLSRVGLSGSWCFVDRGGRYHGMTRNQIEARLASCDLFVDMGTHGAWLDEAAAAGARVLIDGEPGATQMKMEKRLANGEALPDYDAYYSVGQNVGTAASSAPTAGREWRHVFYPVHRRLFERGPRPPADAPFTTIMSWQAHTEVEHDGQVFGAKDREFEKFIDLPARTAVPIELAVAGRAVPFERLRSAGFRIRDSHTETRSYDAFMHYIQRSRGEFSVCKNVFVATRSGWFGDRAAAYLASGRPVVMQETGFSDHLPCGEGLFAVETVDDAADAIELIEGDYDRHSDAARDIAAEYLDTTRVLPAFLAELGVRAGA
jgi:hypothetical protein